VISVAAGVMLPSLAARAAGPKTVFVAGATGQTGRRVVERLSKIDGVSVVGGVRDVEKGAKALAESSVAVRGAMIQQVAGVTSTEATTLKRLDVVKDDVQQMASALEGVDAVVVATGFVPGINPLTMDAAAHAVDNLGTVKLVDAALQAKVPKIVLVSSILTNGRNWGQENSPGFVVTNAFGHVLDEKIQAENHIRKSGLDYTIVRPGGLKAKPPAAGLKVAKEDTLSAGEVSRDFVADVCVAALFDSNASNKVVEIIEDDDSNLKAPLAPKPNLPPKVPFA